MIYTSHHTSAPPSSFSHVYSSFTCLRLICLLLPFFFESTLCPLDLHSFPTRRSSDLSGFRSRHDHRAGGQGLQGSGLDVTRELGTQPARAAVACTGMVAEGPGRGPQRRCASRRP